MRKLLVLLAVAAAAIAVAMVVGVGSGVADPGKGRNNPMPDNPPCDADHSHPGSNVKKCQDREEPPPPPPPPEGENKCTAEAGDEGLSGQGTIAQQAWDNDLSTFSPLTEDPERNGVVSGPLGNAFQPGGDLEGLEVVGDEVTCLIDLLLDEEDSPVDP